MEKNFRLPPISNTLQAVLEPSAHLELARTIHRRGFSDAAIFFLEMHKPLVGCCRELMVMFDPVARALFGQTVCGTIGEICSSSQSIEAFILCLEGVRRGEVVGTEGPPLGHSVTRSKA